MKSDKSDQHLYSQIDDRINKYLMTKIYQVVVLLLHDYE